MAVTTRLQVRHSISKDVTKVYEVSFLFGIRDIPSQVASKVKASPKRLRMFPSFAEASNDICFGDRMDQFFSLFNNNREHASELLKVGCFSFNDDSLVVMFYLRVDHEEPLSIQRPRDSLSSEAMQSAIQGSCEVKQRKRETKSVLNIVEVAFVFVWPRDKNGIPLPTNTPRVG
jgi:hypothetical protein